MKLMRFRQWFFGLSALVLLPSLFSLIFWGFRPSIDFTGGSLLELQFTQPVVGSSITTLQASTPEFTAVQSAGENAYLFRGEPMTNEQKEAFVTLAQEQLGEAEVKRFESVGPTLGRELIQKMLAAGVIVSFFILLYVGRQFKNLQFGLAAVLAMLHDSLVLLGVFSLLGHFFGVEVDVLFVTALLTTLSFSVHDTIVVFDRIRELQRKFPRYSLEQMADRAVSETLVRSFNNSLTIIFMLLALVLLGGESIRWFSVALLVGAVTGTYSSPCIAVPLLLVLEKRKK